MRTWTSPPITGRCGKCGAAIAADERRQILTAPGQTWKLTRCEACATTEAMQAWVQVPTEAEEA